MDKFVLNLVLSSFNSFFGVGILFHTLKEGSYLTVQMVHTFSLNFFLFGNSFASSRNVVLCIKKQSLGSVIRKWLWKSKLQGSVSCQFSKHKYFLSILWAQGYMSIYFPLLFAYSWKDCKKCLDGNLYMDQMMWKDL